MFHKCLIAFLLFIGTAHAQYWEFTIEFTHDYPSQVAYFNLYCRDMTQTWEQGFKWKVPNTMSQNPIITYKTPKVIPINNYYCCAATAVDSNEYESLLPNQPIQSQHDCWDCLWIKSEDLGFSE